LGLLAGYLAGYGEKPEGNVGLFGDLLQSFESDLEVE